MSTDTDWYVYRGQQRWGPYDWEQLLEMAQNGQVIPNDQLWQPDYHGMVTASQVQGLFESPASNSIGSASLPQMQNEKQICPNCQSSDNVQAASSARIPAPIKPSDRPRTFVKVIRLIFGGAFGLAVALFCVLIGGTLMVGGLSTAVGSQYDNTGITSLLFGASLLPLLCVLPIVLLFAGSFTIGLPWLIYRYVNNNYQQRLSLWQGAFNKYSQLFYCSRCAGVFIQGQNRIVPIEQMQSYLYGIQASEPMWPLGG